MVHFRVVASFVYIYLRESTCYRRDLTEIYISESAHAAEDLPLFSKTWLLTEIYISESAHAAEDVPLLF